MAALRLSIFALLCSAAFGVLPAQAQQTAQQPANDSAVIVLDVSNSMWGQVEGKAKIEIARRVITDMIRDWDKARPLGLVAYGHRNAGDCSDIETVIPVGPVDPARFSQTVNGLTPKGKTPLTAAVRLAAQTLNYADVPATVILVSDGIESCNADPCALAEELEKGGVNFTTHVIGFDVARIQNKEQLSCLAERTGGKFLTAKNAKELAGALKQVAEKPAALAITLDAPDLVEVGQTFQVTWTGPGRPSDFLALALPSDAGDKYAQYARLGEGSPTDLNAGKRTGDYEVRYVDGRNFEILARRPIVVADLKASLTAPPSVEVGAIFDVGWQGPGDPNDYITIAAPDMAPGKFDNYRRVKDGNPAELRGPAKPGDYELRYVSNLTQKVIATLPIRVTDVPATLQAPPVAEAGRVIDVTWTGPDRDRDYIAVAKPDDPDHKYANFRYTRDGTPAKLTMPVEPGTYELRYVLSKANRALARLPITVKPVPATLQAPPTAKAGAAIDVIWEGPDNKGDYIAVAAPDAPKHKYVNYTYTRTGSPLKLTMPIPPGTYEIRYVTGQDKKVLAKLPVTVEAVAVTLQAAPTAKAGAAIDVIWEGPNNKGDHIAVAAPDQPKHKYVNYTYTRAGSPLKLTMPVPPGNYEIRYIAGQGKEILAKLPVAVRAVAVALQAPPTANAGAEVEVTWDGPDNKGDFITVAASEMPGHKYVNYTYTRTGSPLKLIMPVPAGDYEIRYVSGQGRKILATLPISIQAVAVTLSAAPSAPYGSDIEVTWTGPDNKKDFITVTTPDAPERKYNKFFYTKVGSPGKLQLPERQGSYEIRYVAGQGRKVLARLPIQLIDVTATLTAPPTAQAGSLLEVAWTRTGAANDIVTIVPAGTADDKLGSYGRTRFGSPLKIRVPKAPGAYEIRYLTGQTRKVLARLPLMLN